MIESFLNYLSAQRGSSDHTIKAYQFDIESFRSYILDEFQLEFVEIERGHVRDWMVYLMEKEQCVPATVRRKISSLKAYWRFLLKQNSGLGDPFSALKLPKIPKRLPNYVRESDLIKLLDDLDLFSDDFEGKRDKMILECFYQTGIRCSELIRLKWMNFNPNDRTLKVFGKRNKERVVPISKIFVEALDDFKSIQSVEFGENKQLIFLTKLGKEMNSRLVYGIVNHYLGYTFSNQKSPHVLRHSFATHMLNNGADLQSIKELLGHSSLAATQVYTHNSLEKVKLVYNQAHPRSH